MCVRLDEFYSETNTMKPIETDAEYQEALKRVEELLTLMELIEAYEAKHFPLLEDDDNETKR